MNLSHFFSPLSFYHQRFETLVEDNRFDFPALPLIAGASMDYNRQRLMENATPWRDRRLQR